MKVAHAEQRVLGSHGLEQTSTFRIKTNAHAFRMLSSGLYSDKIAAVLREIACNAADAHTEYGTPERAIEVKLPNRIDNQLYIRDYGPGLSHEAVMHLYTTYFESSKQNSNDYTGAFGLGSKSPFSYVDQFSIISVHGGKKRTYSAYIGNDGSPTISLLTEEAPDTGWEHGVQIGFPAKPEDFTQFQARAADIYRWFKVTPKILGAPQVNKATILFENDKLMKVAGLTGLGVVMGNVFYPLDLGKLGDLRDEPEAQVVGQFPGIVLKLKIGDVQVAASREHLEYDKASIRALLNALSAAAHVIKDDLSDRLAGATTWAKRCELRKASDIWAAANSWNRVGVYEALFTATGDGDIVAKEKAQALVGNSMNVPTYVGSEDVHAKLVENSYRVRTQKIFKGMRIGSDGDYDGRASLEFYPGTIIAYGVRNLSLARTKHGVDSGKYRQILLFTPSSGTDLAASKKVAEDTAKALGLPPPIDTATLDLPPGYTPKTKGQRKTRGAALTPLPSTETALVYGKTHRQGRVALDQAPESFMTYGGRGFRIYEKNEDDDRSFDPRTWETMWLSGQTIAAAIGLNAHSTYTMLRPSMVIKYELVRRGWKTTYAVMQEWLTDKATRAKLVAALDAWRPSAVLRDHYGNSGFVNELLWLIHNNSLVFDNTVRPLLDPADAKALEDLHAQSVKAGDKAGQNQPPELGAWDALAAEFKLEPLRAKRGQFLTVNDLETHFTNTYPAAAVTGAFVMRNVFDKRPDRFAEFMQFILRR